MTTDAQPAPTDAEIDALRDSFDWEGWIDPKNAQSAFARAVLAKWGQPAHSGEPVAWVDERVISWLANSRANSATIGTTLEKGKSSERPLPLYTAPQPVEREPLPSVEIMRIVMGVEQQHNVLRGTTNWAAAVGRAIEAAHGITKGGQHGTE